MLVCIRYSMPNVINLEDYKIETHMDFTGFCTK